MVDINIEYLKKLKKNIETLDQCHHPKILDIIKENDIKFSENRNGIFVNMNQLNKKTIEKINIFLEYVKAQEKHLSDIESLKSNFKKEYFNKQDKETNAYI